MLVNELTIKQQDRILVIAPHPDDESIGAGGLLHKFADQCTVWIMTDGRYGNEKYSTDEMIAVRKMECINAMRVAGISNVIYMDYEDGSLIGHRECYDLLDFSSFTMVFLPNPMDNHSDHTAVYQYAIEKLQNSQIRVFLYEVHTPLADISCYIDITSEIDSKKQMVASYTSQMEIHPYDEQVVALSEFRGLQNEQAGRMLETYREVSCVENASISTGIEIELAKYKYFTRILSLWLQQNKNASIAERLVQNGYRKIAIYGYGILGKQLVSEIKEQICTIEYIVEKNEKVVIRDEKILVMHKIRDMKPVDVVIVTTYINEKIINEIQDCVGLKCITVEEVLNLSIR